MKNTLHVLIGFILIAGMLSPHYCLATSGPNVLQTKTASGYWELGAGNNYPWSMRNFQYRFDLTGDQGSLDILLESPDTDVSLWLYDPLGQLVQQQWGGRSLSIKAQDLRAGAYRVIAGTNERHKSGAFTLRVSGAITDLVLYSGSTKTTAGSWLSNGGGNNYPWSFRNHRYHFEVTEANTTLDVVMESQGADLSLWLFDPLGQLVHQQWGGRITYIVAQARKGKYLVVAGTNERDVVDAQYTLNVNGKITDLVPVPSQDIQVSGTIANGAGNNAPTSTQNTVYMFDVTRSNSAIDIILESPDFDLSLWVFDPNGELIIQQWGVRTTYVVTDARKGKYRIVCGTNEPGQAGQFRLSLVGEFENFKKN